MELLFHDEFSISDCEISEEKVNDAYCYRVKAEIVRELGRARWLVIFIASVWINQRIKVERLV